jgi:uncharacterized protein (TIGR00299 family) protein
LEDIRKELAKLPLDGYDLSKKRVRRSGLSATKIDVVLSPVSRSGLASEARKWADIEGIIGDSLLPEDLKRKGRQIMKSLFQTEAKVHGTSLGKVHLHELGAVDCLVDVFGTLIALRLLGVEAVYSSPVNLGGGTVQTNHGVLPVPAPATAELLRRIPVYSSGIPFELTTPTGAALLKSLSQAFGDMPAFVPELIGIGAGNRNIEGTANVLRVWIGEKSDEEHAGRETITMIETNIDDMSPQVYEYVMDRLFQKGALDVYTTQILMKKSRPAIKLSILCRRSERDELTRTVLQETTSIGVRYCEMSRAVLGRRYMQVVTKYGRVRIKVSGEGKDKKFMPEYEDCKKIAREKVVPLLRVIEEAINSAMRRAEEKGSL